MIEFARKHPAALMVAITFSWTWSFWFVAFNFLAEPQGLRLGLFLLGGFGPAIGGVLALRIEGGRIQSGQLRMGGFFVGAGLAFTALALFYFDVLGVTTSTGPSKATGILAFPADSPAYVYVLMTLIVLISGYVFASPQSRNERVCSYFAGLVPNRRTLLLAIPVVLFFPVLLITGNAIARSLGSDFEEPLYLQMPVSVWLPVMTIKLFTVAMLTGGNEEHGWRGVLQPLLQKITNPLVATLIIGVVWELWHLPLVLNGIYGEGDPTVIVVSRMLSIVPIAFLLSVIYNGSRGSIFLCVLSHACMNSQIGYFAGSQLSHLIGVLIVVVAFIMLRLWRRDAGYFPAL